MMMAARGSQESNRRLTHYGAPLCESLLGRVPSPLCIPEIRPVLQYRAVLYYNVEIHHRQEKFICWRMYRVFHVQSPQRDRCPANSLQNTGYTTPLYSNITMQYSQPENCWNEITIGAREERAFCKFFEQHSQKREARILTHLQQFFCASLTSCDNCWRKGTIIKSSWAWNVALKNKSRAKAYEFNILAMF